MRFIANAALSSKLIGHMGTGFYGSNNPTDSVKALKFRPKALGANRELGASHLHRSSSHRNTHKTKVNQIQQNIRIQITQTKQTKPRFGRFLQPPAWKRSGTILLEREGMDKRRK